MQTTKLCGRVFERQCVMRGQRSFQVIGRINLKTATVIDSASALPIYAKCRKDGVLDRFSRLSARGAPMQAVFQLERTRSYDVSRILAWGTRGTPMQVVFQLEGRAEH